MTELWCVGKKRMPIYMARVPYFDYILAVELANFNIFTWDLFYMISSHKLHIIIAKLQLSNY